jgi:hypothetical protein
MQRLNSPWFMCRRAVEQVASHFVDSRTLRIQELRDPKMSPLTTDDIKLRADGRGDHRMRKACWVRAAQDVGLRQRIAGAGAGVELQPGQARYAHERRPVAEHCAGLGECICLRPQPLKPAGNVAAKASGANAATLDGSAALHSIGSSRIAFCEFSKKKRIAARGVPARPDELLSVRRQDRPGQNLASRIQAQFGRTQSKLVASVEQASDHVRSRGRIASPDRQDQRNGQIIDATREIVQDLS